MAKRLDRRIFIGDIQGCRKELEKLLEKVRFDPATDELHPVGDLVNRGPDSLGVLRLLKELDAGGVLGNHDLHLIQRAAGLRPASRRDTLDGLLEAEDKKDLVAWLKRRPFVRAWPDLYLVHAGFNPRWKNPVKKLKAADPLKPDDDARFAVRVRHCDSKGRLPDSDSPAPSAPFAPWFEFYESDRHEGRLVVFGHWSQLGLVHEPDLRGLDTGCVWGGKLTAWIAEEDRLVQVEARKAYSPL